MTRCNIKETEKVLKKYRNNAIWNTMPQYAEGFGLAPTMKPMGEGKTVAAPRAAEAPKAPEKIDFSRVEIEPLFKDFVDFDTFSKSDFRAVKVLACEAVPKSRKLLKFTLNDGTGENRTILRGIG